VKSFTFSFSHPSNPSISQDQIKKAGLSCFLFDWRCFLDEVRILFEKVLKTILIKEEIEYFYPKVQTTLEGLTNSN